MEASDSLTGLCCPSVPSLSQNGISCCLIEVRAVAATVVTIFDRDEPQVVSLFVLAAVSGGDIVISSSLLTTELLSARQDPDIETPAPLIQP